MLKLFAIDKHFLAGGFVVGQVVQLGSGAETEAELALDDVVVGLVPFASSSTCWAEYCLIPQWRYPIVADTVGLVTEWLHSLVVVLSFRIRAMLDDLWQRYQVPLWRTRY